MKNLTERLVGALIAVFLLTYTGFQVLRFFETPYQTQTAANLTIADSAKVTGVIIRDERVITDQVEGAVSYLHGDGTKVTKFNDIAELYTSKTNIQLQKKIRELTMDIEMLKTSADTASVQYINAESLSRQISQSVSRIVGTSATGRVGEMGRDARELTLLLNRNQVVTGKPVDFENRIAELTAQRDKLSAQLSGNFTPFKSPDTGYFARMVDGLEGTLTPDAVAGMTVAQIEAFTGQKVQYSDAYLGKIILDQNWTYAAIVPKNQVSKFRVGDRVRLNFNLYNLGDIPFVIRSVKTDDTSGNAVVFLENNYVLPELLAVRNPSADVVFREYSGLKVPTSAKRYEGQQVGVYVVENDVVRFKTVNIVYENQEFMLCGANTDTQRPLKLFDRVIVEGSDLRDGKPIQ